MDSSSKHLMFIDFCNVCDKISSARREQKAGILEKFISDYKATNVSI